MSTKVLLIDDNALYRGAFKRNLLMNSYEVVEAGNSDEATAVFQAETPDIVITDLSMRTPREGLDVIRSIKQLDPLTPVVMISAVGTFEEGAEAHSLGAARVLSKASIDLHIEELYKAIDAAHETGRRNRAARTEIDRTASDPDNIPPAAILRLRQLAADASLHPVVRGEAYDVLLLATEAERRGAAEEPASDELREPREPAADETLAALAGELPGLDRLSPESLKELRNAEFLYHRQGDSRLAQGGDYSRNIGFSYCFAVENEAKRRLRKRLQKFLSSKENLRMAQAMLDPGSRKLDLLVHQYLLRLHQQIPFDFTIDNVRQVLARVLEHEHRYKPDGLKALGILLVLFGRDYTMRTIREVLHVNNPLNIRGFESDLHLLRFAHLLVALQHYRNPYIHPEISEREQLSKIRATALMCLKEMAKLGN
jgi:DNA-binding response OmpR family regulator